MSEGAGSVPREASAGGVGLEEMDPDQYEEAIGQVEPALIGEGTGAEEDDIQLSDEEFDRYAPERLDLRDKELLEKIENLDVQLGTSPSEFESVPTAPKLDEWGKQLFDLSHRLNQPDNFLEKNARGLQAANVSIRNLETILDPEHWILKHGEVREDRLGNKFKVQDIESLFERIADVAKTKGSEDKQLELARSTVEKRMHEAGKTGTPSKEDVDQELKIVKTQYDRVKKGPALKTEGASDRVLGFDSMHDLIRYTDLLTNLSICLKTGAKPRPGSGSDITLDAAIKGIEDRVTLSRAIRAKGPDYLLEFRKRLRAAKGVANRSRAIEGDTDDGGEEEFQAAEQARRDEEEKNKARDPNAPDTRSNDFTFGNYVGLVRAVSENKDNAFTREQQQDVDKHALETVQAAKLTAMDFWQQEQALPADASAADKQDAHQNFRGALGDMHQLLRAERGVAGNLGQLASRPPFHEEYSQLKREVRGTPNDSGDDSST